MSVAAKALHGVNVCLIPSPFNDEKPLVLRRKSLATISAAMLAVKVIAFLTVAILPAQADLSVITVNRIVQLTNDERVKAGLKPLTTNSKLAAAAQDKGKNMLEQDYFAHISPSGVTPWYWIKKHGYVYQVAGENLAIDFTEAEDVVAAWIASPSHKANILHDEYTETGVAVVTGEFQGGTSTIVVHMFGLPQAQAETVSAPQTAGSTTATPPPVGGSTPAATIAPAATPVPVATAAPTIAPTPSATPSPIKVPRIAYTGPGTTIGSTVSLNVSGDPNSTVYILANSSPTAHETLSEEGTTQLSVDVSDIADGPVVLRAYASSQGIQSELSEAVALTKDTTGPDIATSDLIFVLSPFFDTAKARVSIPTSPSNPDIRILDADKNQTLSVEDEFGNETVLENISLDPIFDTTLSKQELVAPRSIIAVSRRIAAGVLVALTLLLFLTIVVRIHIQKPALIANVSVVILLAGVLFLI